MEDNYYKLVYKDGNTEVTYEMPGDIDVFTLAENLQRFLLACSWQKTTLDKVLIVEDN